MRFFEQAGSDDDRYSSSSSAQGDERCGEEGYDYSEYYSDIEQPTSLNRGERAELDVLEASQKTDDFALDVGRLESTLDQLTLAIIRNVSDKSLNVDQLGKIVASFFTDPALPVGPTSLDMLEYYQSCRDKKAHEILLAPRVLSVFMYAACKCKPRVLQLFKPAIKKLKKQDWLTILSHSPHLPRLLAKVEKNGHSEPLSSWFAKLKDANPEECKKLLLACPYVIALAARRACTGDPAIFTQLSKVLAKLPLPELSVMLEKDSDFLMPCAQAVSGKHPDGMMALNTVLLSCGRKKFDDFFTKHPLFLEYAAYLASKSAPLLLNHMLPKLITLSAPQLKSYFDAYPNLFRYCTHAAAKGHSLPLCVFSSALNQMTSNEQNKVFSSVLQDPLAKKGIDNYLSASSSIATCQQFLQNSKIGDNTTNHRIKDANTRYSQK